MCDQIKCYLKFNFFVQLLQHASVLVRGLKILDSGAGRDSAVFSR